MPLTDDETSASGIVRSPGIRARIVDTPAKDTTKRRLLYLGALAFVSTAFLLRAWLLVPASDDGVIGNVILERPYYSEYHAVYLPFFKPFTTALMPLRFVPYPASFALIALLHGLLIAASAYVTYLIARRHMPAHAAIGGGVIALYALFTLDPLPPMRPEGLLLLTILTIAYLADTWRLERESKYLLGAGALTGALALPMHTNASIAYLFLGFFALWHVRRLRLRDWVGLTGGLVISSLVGLVIVLAPHPSDLSTLLAQHAGDQHRFTFIVGEARRFTFLLRPAPLLPFVVFFGTVGLVALLRERGRISNEWSGFMQRYSTLLILGFAAFVALAFLPSAEWGYYLAYYLPVLAVLASLAYERGCPSLPVGVGVGCLVVGAICAEAVALFLLRDEMEAWVLTGLVYGAVAAVFLCVSWVSRRREWLAAALILGVVVRLGLMAADHEAHADVVAALRDRAAEVGGMVLAPPEFAWAFAGYEFHDVESPPPGIGVVAGPRGDLTEAGSSHSCTLIDIEPIPLNNFVSNRFRGGEKLWELATIACEDPPPDRSSG